MTKITVDAILLADNMRRRFVDDVRNAFDTAITDGVKQVKARTAKDRGDLRRGYAAVPTKLRDGVFEGELINPTQNSLYRERGRAPGKFPPFGKRTRLAGWAKRRNLSPYLVAKKIAEKGTDRWIKNENALGIDRTSTEQRIKPQTGGILASIPNNISATLRKTINY